jgi:hypothetical protein
LFELGLLGVVNAGQVIDDHEIDHCSDESAEQVVETLADVAMQLERVPAVEHTLEDQKDRQPPGEGHDDEHRGDHRGVIGLPCDDETEDRTGTGRHHQTPDKRSDADRLRIGIQLPVHQQPDIEADETEKHRVEHHVPAEHRGPVDMRHRDDQTICTPEVEHDHEQAGGEQRKRKQTGQGAARLINFLAEHRADRGDVQTPPEAATIRKIAKTCGSPQTTWLFMPVTWWP